MSTNTDIILNRIILSIRDLPLNDLLALDTYIQSQYLLEPAPKITLPWEEDSDVNPDETDETDKTDETEDPKKETEVVVRLSDDQEVAFAKLKTFLDGKEPFFILRGYAGTGKSFLMKMLLRMNDDNIKSSLPTHNFFFSAPTNKASAVLSEYLGHKVKTTYSLLGLRMTAEDDQMVLKMPDKLPDLGVRPILVIDESGMIPKFMSDLLVHACQEYGWRIIFVGDPAQLNPVGESRSPVWSTTRDKKNRVLMKQVVRFDNELLALSTSIRERIETKDFQRFIVEPNNKNGEGVFVETRSGFEAKIRTVKNWDTTKVVVWRNKTADYYNGVIREALGLGGKYAVGDLILLGSPYNVNGQLIAYTDEEFRIAHIAERNITLPEGDISAYVFALDERLFSFTVPKDQTAFQSILNTRAAIASQADGKHRKHAWKQFWDLKDRFQNVRYGYALTAHRLQGSTLDHAFIDRPDILANSNKLEALRCLYVAATRPRFSLTSL